MYLKELGKFRSTEKSINLRKLIEANIYIYKENMKVILNSCVDNVCLFETDPIKLENDIRKAFDGNDIGRIDEAEEDDEASHSSKNHTPRLDTLVG